MANAVKSVFLQAFLGEKCGGNVLCKTIPGKHMYLFVNHLLKQKRMDDLNYIQNCYRLDENALLSVYSLKVVHEM